ASNLGAGQKIRFLLDEVQQLDTSTNKNEAARALFRWAMIARTLYGPESASGYSSAQVRYDGFGQPLPAKPDPDEPKKKIWELADDEAITLVGAKLRLVTLPPKARSLCCASWSRSIPTAKVSPKRNTLARSITKRGSSSPRRSRNTRPFWKFAVRSACRPSSWRSTMPRCRRNARSSAPAPFASATATVASTPAAYCVRMRVAWTTSCPARVAARH